MFLYSSKIYSFQETKDVAEDKGEVVRTFLVGRKMFLTLKENMILSKPMQNFKNWRES